MDGVLAKPLDPEVLTALLARAGLGALRGETLLALRRFEGWTGEDLVGQVLASFLVDGQRWLAEMRAALAAGDAGALAEAAHALSGAAAVLRAPALEQSCAGLETSARSGDVTAAFGLVAAVAEAYGRVAAELRLGAPEARLQGGPAVAQGAEGRLDAVGRAELGEDPGQMDAHGRLGDAAKICLNALYCLGPTNETNAERGCVMKKLTPMKLRLNKETLANLNERRLAEVVGGTPRILNRTFCNTDCTCPNTEWAHRKRPSREAPVRCPTGARRMAWLGLRCWPQAPTKVLWRGDRRFARDRRLALDKRCTARS